MRNLLIYIATILCCLLFLKSVDAAVVWDGGSAVQTYKNAIKFGTNEQIKVDGSGDLKFVDSNSVERPVSKSEADFLLNRSFEKSHSGSPALSWTLSGATGTVSTSSPIDGSQLLSLSLSSTLSLSQEITQTQFYPNVVSFSLWVKSSITDIQLCSTLATVEQECVTYDGSDQWKKLQVLVTAPSSGAMGLKLKTLSTTSGTILVDAGEFSSNPLKFQEGVNMEDITYTGNTSRDGSGYLKFATVKNDTGQRLIEDDNSGTNTRITFLRKVKFSANYAYNGAATSGAISLTLFNSSGTPILVSFGNLYTSGVEGATMVAEANSGDYILASSPSGSITNNYNTNFSVVAYEKSPQVLTANDVVSSETINWQRKQSAITDCGGADAIGTYNTYSKAASSNTFTLCTTTDPTVLPNNTDGFYIQSVAYGNQSTCNDGNGISRVDICIGKGLKGVYPRLYQSANKGGNELNTLYYMASSTEAYGLYNDYNETTGIYSVVSGFNVKSTITSYSFLSVDGGGLAYTKGYFHFAASKNPVISALDAVPRIDYSWENTFSAVITNTGVVTSENYDFISGNCTNANPTVCTFNSGFFTQTPSCTATTNDNTDSDASIRAQSSTSISVWTGLSNVSSTEYGINIVCQRQGSDYRLPGGDVAAIIAQPTIWVKNTQTDGTSGGSMSSGAWTTNTLNTLEGSNTFGASLSANQITLPKGTYKIEWNAPFVYNFINQSWGVRTQLYSITNSATALYGDFAYAYTSWNDETSINSHGYGTLVLSSAETFELRYYSNRAQATYGLGVNDGITFGLEVYATVKITKVR